MEVTRKDGENQEIIFTIVEDIPTWQKAIDQAAKKISGTIDIPGFRRGKAPRSFVEKHVGQRALLNEASELLGPKLFQAAMEQEHIEFGAYPQITCEQAEMEKPYILKAVVTPKPKVTLGEYKGLKVEKKVEPVTDEAVEARIQKMRERKAQLIDAPEGAEAKLGDLATIDFKGYVDGEAFEGGEGKDYPLTLGSGSFIPGFEDQLVGAKAGEAREVKVTFPEEYREKKLAGKEATFQCTLQKLKHKRVPELDDAFVQQISVFKTVDELRQDVRSQMEKAAEAQAENAFHAAAIDQAADNITVDIPKAMIEEAIDQMVRESAMRLEQQTGIKFEQYLQHMGGDINKIREPYRERAEREVRTSLMLEAVAAAEGVEVTEDDINAEIAMIAQMYNAGPAQVKKIIRDQGRRDDLKVTIMRRKTAKLIVDHIAQ